MKSLILKKNMYFSSGLSLIGLGINGATTPSLYSLAFVESWLPNVIMDIMDITKLRK